MMNKQKSQLIAAAVIVLVLAGLIIVLARQPGQRLPQIQLDEFAKCLTDKGAVMYGTYWCPACQSQKAMFGDAVEFIRYVECTKEPQTCIDAGATSIPMWVFADGAKLVGAQSLESLAQASGCLLPAQP